MVNATKIVQSNIDTLLFSESFVMDKSVTILKKGVPIDRYLWRLQNGDNPVITILYTREEPETLTIQYSVPSLPIGSVFRKRTAITADEAINIADSENTDEDNNRSESDKENNIVVGGSKTVGITVGSGGALTINQTLDLSVYGEISKGVEVRARLLDNNLPFKSEGTTESLREIDKIVMEIRAQNGALIFGDQSFTDNNSHFVQFDRKIKGISGELKGPYYQINAGAALSDGVFHSHTFSGVEGRQGPYIIIDGRGRAGAVVLAGTEKVFVNGSIKVRGEGNDYTMDYSTGRLTFTSKCFITGDDVITVEFEFLDSDYYKSVLKAGTRLSLMNNRLQLVFSGLKDEDDYKNPAAAEFTEKEMEGLRLSGDSAVADGNGARKISFEYAGILRGFYTYELPFGFSDSHYVYHNATDTPLFRGKDIYDVTFLGTGEGRGDYTRDIVTDSSDPGRTGTYSTARVIYRFVGDGNGDYKPGRVIVSPIKHNVGYGAYLYKDSVFSGRGEIALSQKDLNTLSHLDDDDNTGYAFFNDLLVKLGALTLNLKQEEINDKFRAPGAIKNGYQFSKLWNISQSIIGAKGVSSQEAEAVLRLPLAGEIRGGGGRLKIGNILAYRGEASGNLSLDIIDRLRFGIGYIRTEEINFTDEMYRLRLFGEKAIYATIPSFSFEGDYGSSAISQEGRVGVRSKHSGSVTGSTVIAGRVDSKKENNGWIDSSTALTWINNLNIDFGKPLQADISASNRINNRLYHGAESRVNSAIISTNGRSSLFNEAFEQRLKYNMSAEQSQVMTTIYLPVPAGTGSYIKDSLTHEYIYREGGNFIYGGLVADTLSPLKDGLKTEILYGFTFLPGNLMLESVKRGFLKYITVRTDLTGEQEAGRSDDIPFWRLYLPDINKDRAARTPLYFYRLESVNEVAFISKTRLDKYVKFYFTPKHRFSTRTERESDRWESMDYMLTIGYPLSKNISLIQKSKLEEIKRYSALTGNKYNVMNKKVSADIRYKKGVLEDVFCELTAGISSVTPSYAATIPFIYNEIGYARSFVKGGRMSVKHSISRVSYDGALSIPFEAADGKRGGVTNMVAVAGSIEAGKNINIDLYINWENNSKEEKPLARANMELKAFF